MRQIQFCPPDSQLEGENSADMKLRGIVDTNLCQDRGGGRRMGNSYNTATEFGND